MIYAHMQIPEREREAKIILIIYCRKIYQLSAKWPEACCYFIFSTFSRSSLNMNNIWRQEIILKNVLKCMKPQNW